MRKRQLYLVVIGVVLAGVIVILSRREREPDYRGTRLMVWVQQIFAGSASGKREGEEAIRQIGTNALPYLVKWVSNEIPPWKRKFYASTNPAIKRFRRFWRIFDKG